MIIEDFKIDPSAVIVSDQEDLITAEQYWNTNLIVVSLDNNDLDNLDVMKQYQARIAWTVKDSIGFNEITTAGIMISNELNITMFMLKRPEIREYKKEFWDLYSLNFEQHISKEIESYLKGLEDAQRRLEMLHSYGAVDYQDYIGRQHNIQSIKLKRLLQSIRTVP
jgi:hypothetical protein